LRELLAQSQRGNPKNYSVRKLSRSKKEREKMIYKIETKQGFLPYEFDSKKEALDYVAAFLSWSGTKYRLHGPIITAKEKTEGNK
jgi:hypothetical protein